MTTHNTQERDLRTALTDARQWVEHAVAPLRPLSPEAAKPGEDLLKRIDAALRPAPPRPVDAERVEIWGVENTGNAIWVGPMRPDGVKIDRVVYFKDDLGLHRPEYVAQVKADAYLICNSVNAALAPKPTGTEAGRGVGVETSDQIFDRIKIELMVREWLSNKIDRPLTQNSIDGLVRVLRINFRRIDPAYRPTGPVVRATLMAIADARGITEDRVPAPTKPEPVYGRDGQGDGISNATAAEMISTLARDARETKVSAATPTPPVSPSPDSTGPAAVEEIGDAPWLAYRKWQDETKPGYWCESGFRAGYAAGLAALTPSAPIADPSPDSTGQGDAQTDDLLWLRTQVFALCEDTEDKMQVELEKPDLIDHARGFHKGRAYEAKGIRRTIAEVVRCRLAERSQGDAQIGPRTVTTSRKTCEGCPALAMKDWSFEGENDDMDSGTSAKCSASAGKSITAYWSVLSTTPDWCPALTVSQGDAQAQEGGDALDAARFRALMRCGRISMQGSCGVNAKTGERTYLDQPGAVHFGAEFWVEPEAITSNQTIWGRYCLRALADDILAFEGTGRAPETDGLVDRFAVALKAKLRSSEEKYGWQNGWLKPDWSEACQRDLARHVAKGDPLDVAAYAAFCWHHDWPTAAASYQDRVAAWVAEVSKDDPFDLSEHRDRFVEEALELAQSLNQTAADAHALVDYVFGRPVGEPHQEAGGTMVTLAKLASAAGLDMAEAGDAELSRCWRPEVLEKIRRKRLTRHGRGPLPGVSPSAPVSQGDAQTQEGGR